MVDKKFLTREDVELDYVDVNISDSISKKMLVDSEFYVTNEYTSIIMYKNTFSKKFGIQNYRIIALYLSDNEQVLTDEKISDIISLTQGLTINNYTQQRRQMKK